MSYQGTSSPPRSTQNLKSAGHSSSYNNTWGRVDQEEVLLDDIEAATKRIYNQSKGLNEESKAHVGLLNKVENDMTLASLALRAETVHAEKMRKAKSGVCWMYCVIIIELIFLIFLVYIGLSNS